MSAWSPRPVDRATCRRVRELATDRPANLPYEIVSKAARIFLTATYATIVPSDLWEDFVHDTAVRTILSDATGEPRPDTLRVYLTKSAAEEYRLIVPLVRTRAAIESVALCGVDPLSPADGHRLPWQTSGKWFRSGELLCRAREGGWPGWVQRHYQRRADHHIHRSSPAGLLAVYKRLSRERFKACSAGARRVYSAARRSQR